MGFARSRPAEIRDHSSGETSSARVLLKLRDAPEPLLGTLNARPS